MASRSEKTDPQQGTETFKIPHICYLLSLKRLIPDRGRKQNDAVPLLETSVCLKRLIPDRGRKLARSQFHSRSVMCLKRLIPDRGRKLLPGYFVCSDLFVCLKRLIPGRGRKLSRCRNQLILIQSEKTDPRQGTETVIFSPFRIVASLKRLIPGRGRKHTDQNRNW